QRPTEETPALAEVIAYIKADGKLYRLNFKEIRYAEAAGNNVKIVTDITVLTPAITFNALENLLPKSNFVRLHRSFIINKDKISHIDVNRVFIGSQEIPIGANFKELFLRQLGFR